MCMYTPTLHTVLVLCGIQDCMHVHPIIRSVSWSSSSHAQCMLVGCSIPVLGAVGYRYVHMHTPVLYILYTLPEMVQCTCTLPLLWCAPQVTSTNHRILATRYACRSGMHTCISCSDVHHVVYIYSAVHRQQQRTYIVYVHSTLHAVQYCPL